jgi:hypothetical protein
MKPPHLVAIVDLTTLIGCGEDSGGKRRSLIEADTSGLITDVFSVPSYMHRSIEMDLLASIGLPNIKWRLPTRNDYLQADLNGIRFVLKTANSPFWTATMNSASTNRSEAWTYNQSQRTIEKVAMTDLRQVRCIGAASL